MTSGGARPKSGIAPDPRSARSDARGLKFNALPAEGYSGDVPEFPRPVVFGSELSHWNAVWSTPQAALWATPQWSWIVPAVAHYCSLMAQSELAECPAGVHAQIRGMRGEILLTQDALLRAGYHVVADEVGEKRSESSDASDAPMSARERAKLLRAVGDE